MACQAGELSFCVLSRFASLVARGSIAKTPYFPKTISCPAAIIGETGDSGLSLGLGEMAKLRGLSRFDERFVGQSGGRAYRFEIRADNRRFPVRFCFAPRRAGRGKKDNPPGVEKRMLILKEILERKIRTVEGLDFNRWSRSGMRT